MAWAIRGFCVGGITNNRGEREGPENPVVLDRFRQHLRHLTELLFQLSR